MTKIINIASLRKPAPVTVVTEDGSKHEMVPASVAHFLENLRKVEALGLDASPLTEAELILDTIDRSFPTLERKEIESWPMDIVKNLYITVITANGEMVSDNPETLEEAKKTGKSAPEA